MNKIKKNQIDEAVFKSDIVEGSSDFILKPSYDGKTIISEGKICTIDLENEDYRGDTIVAMKNEAAATSIVLIAVTGWKYQLNDSDYVDLIENTDITLTWLKGATCTVIIRSATKKILIDGGVE